MKSVQLLLVTGMMLIQTIAFASNGRHDVAVTSLITSAIPKNAPPPAPGTAAMLINQSKFKQGDKVRVECDYKFNVTDVKKETGKWTIGLYVDNKKIGNFAGIWPVYHVHHSSTLFSSSVSYSYDNMQSDVVADWTATPGNHRVRCVLNDNHFLNDTKPGNNVKTRMIKVPIQLHAMNMKPISRKKPLQKSSNTAADFKPHNGFVKNALNPHLRSCRSSLSARVDIDKNQLFGRYGPASKVPEASLTLYLKKSQLINDTVFCTYATRQNLAKTTIEIPCKHAQSDKHNSFHCQ